MLEKLYLLWLKHASLRDFENVENAHRALSTSSNAHLYILTILLFYYCLTLYQLYTIGAFWRAANFDNL